MNPNLITLSHPTYVGASGATAAATHRFFTKDYKPPVETRAVETDVVINHNGRFKYVYDNGPGFKAWAPFSIVCEEKFAQFLGATAGAQYEQLRKMWAYKGVFGMSAPDGAHLVHWSGSSLERNFRVYPAEVNHQIEYEVVVQVEEGQ